MTFFQIRGNMLNAVRKLGEQRCAYGTFPDGRCDCKYGANGRGEETGCPELRSLYAVLKVITDEEWHELGHRAGGVFLAEHFPPKEASS